MRKPQFGVVIGLLAVFFVLGLFRDFFEKFIPPLPPNKLANRPGGFLRAAVHEPVDWQPQFAGGLREATRLQKPCFVVLGCTSSNVGRLMDQRVFSNWAVAARINASFVPIRIDLCDEPRWRPAVFPISRMKIPFDDGFQILILDSDGTFKKYLSPPQDLAQVDPTQFLDDLVAIKEEFDSKGSSGDTQMDSSMQEDDLAELNAAVSVPEPQFNRYAEEVTNRSFGPFGAFAEPGFLKMLPNAWVYLFRVGRLTAARRSLLGFLLSPASDMLRGGFYNVDESSEQFTIDSSQETEANALMAAALSEFALVHHERIFSYFARQTFDMLLRDLRPERLFITCRPSDLDLATGHSPVASFPLSRLNDLLNPGELAWAVDHLNLNRFQNRQMIPYLDQAASLDDPLGKIVLRKLRGSLERGNHISGDQYLDVNGATFAALCRCTRLWGDDQRFAELLPTITEIEKFSVGKDVSHTRAAKSASDFVGDYLGFSDAELQLALSTGDVARFTRGLTVLQRAIHKFYDSSNQQMMSVPEGKVGKMPKGLNNPDLCDDCEESTTSQAIRLCSSYGRMLGPSAEGQKLLQVASEMVAKNSNLSSSMSPSMAGYYLAAASLMDSECAFAVGPTAKQDADRLFLMRPSRLVAAVNSSVRPDLLNRPSGIYLASGTSIEGPFTVEKAAENMPLTLQVGVTPERLAPLP
jgi:uncharacterized protein YyaL (SSP411 family)